MSSDLEANRPAEAAWYVIHTQSGREKKVHDNLITRVAALGLDDQILDVVIPTAEVIEIQEGKKRFTPKRILPGYILVRMIMSRESWRAVRGTPGVSAFMQSEGFPTPLSPEDLAGITDQMGVSVHDQTQFHSGDVVAVTQGPFAGFQGKVVKDANTDVVVVSISLLGENRDLEIDASALEVLRRS